MGDIFLRERALFEEQSDLNGEGGAADVVGRNMPPIAGALGWCSALMERIREEWESEEEDQEDAEDSLPGTPVAVCDP